MHDVLSGGAVVAMLNIMEENIKIITKIYPEWM